LRESWTPAGLPEAKRKAIEIVQYDKRVAVHRRNARVMGA